MLVQVEEFGSLGKQAYYIEHVNKQRLPRALGFTHQQAVTFHGRLMAFADCPELEQQDRVNIGKRELITFDGVDWSFT